MVFFFNKGDILTFVALLSFLALLRKSIPDWTQKILPCSGCMDLKTDRHSNSIDINEFAEMESWKVRDKNSSKIL